MIKFLYNIHLHTIFSQVPKAINEIVQQSKVGDFFKLGKKVKILAYLHAGVSFDEVMLECNLHRNGKISFCQFLGVVTFITSDSPIDHIPVACLVAWPLNESQTGVRLVLI